MPVVGEAPRRLRGARMCGMQAAPPDGPLDRMWHRGRTSLRVRVGRVRSKSFAIAQ